MSDLNEYEVTRDDGTKVTVQLTEADAKNYPHARKVGKRAERSEQAEQQGGAKTPTPGPSTHTHGQVQNRARQQK